MGSGLTQLVAPNTGSRVLITLIPKYQSRAEDLQAVVETEA